MHTPIAIDLTAELAMCKSRLMQPLPVDTLDPLNIQNERCPSSNGVAEKSWSDLLSMARCILHDQDRGPMGLCDPACARSRRSSSRSA